MKNNRSDRAYRLMLVASQNNDISVADEEAQVIDILRNLHHLVEDYPMDIDLCMEKAKEMYQSDLSSEPAKD